MKSLRVWILVGLGTLITVSAAFAATATDYYQAGAKFYTDKDYTHALPYLSAALKLEPNNSQALQVRAFCYYALGQYQEALADYQKLLSFNPSDAKLTAFVGQVNAKIRAAASRKGSTAAKTSAASGVPAGTGTSANAVSAAGTSAAAPQENSEVSNYRDAMIARLTDWFKDYRKDNQKWPETEEAFREFLNDSRKHKNDGWELDKYLGLAFSELPSGSLSVKFSFKVDVISGDAQFTLKPTP